MLYFATGFHRCNFCCHALVKFKRCVMKSSFQFYYEALFMADSEHETVSSVPMNYFRNCFIQRKYVLVCMTKESFYFWKKLEAGTRDERNQLLGSWIPVVNSALMVINSSFLKYLSQKGKVIKMIFISTQSHVSSTIYTLWHS